MSTAPINEELRRAVREVLATRPNVALPLAGIRRRIETGRMVDGAFTDDGLRAALIFWLGVNQIKQSYDTAGSTEYFQATTEGILAFERGQ